MSKAQRNCVHAASVYRLCTVPPRVHPPLPHSLPPLLCDVSIANTDGVWKSRMLGTLLSIDPRALELARLVKLWSKWQGINDPTRRTFNSYGLLLMVGVVGVHGCAWVYVYVGGILCAWVCVWVYCAYTCNVLGVCRYMCDYVFVHQPMYTMRVCVQACTCTHQHTRKH